MMGRIIAATFQFRFMALAIDVIDRRDPSNEMRRQLQPNKTKVRPLYSSKRCSSHKMRRSVSVLKKWLCRTGRKWRNALPFIAKED